ncbi:hypothetical protein F4810DRAFT_710150 [Camillea tinctor]|nr:hypothetical protein F4810DRAFT_710150 [Camillea tinctor]
MSTFGKSSRVITYGESHCRSAGGDAPLACILPKRPSNPAGQSSITTPRNAKDRVTLLQTVDRAAQRIAGSSARYRNAAATPPAELARAIPATKGSGFGAQRHATKTNNSGGALAVMDNGEGGGAEGLAGVGAEGAAFVGEGRLGKGKGDWV